MSSPTQLSLQHLRKLGCIAAVVEHFNPHIKIRQDLFGVFDIVAVHPLAPGTLYVQVTSRDHVPDRMAKVMAAPATKTILQAGNRIAVHGWSKKGKAGKRKLWTLDAFPVTLPTLPESDREEAESAGDRS